MRSVSKIFVQLDALGELVMTTVMKEPGMTAGAVHLLYERQQFVIGSWSIAPIADVWQLPSTISQRYLKFGKTMHV